MAYRPPPKQPFLRNPGNSKNSRQNKPNLTGNRISSAEQPRAATAHLTGTTDPPSDAVPSPRREASVDTSGSELDQLMRLRRLRLEESNQPSTEQISAGPSSTPSAEEQKSEATEKAGLESNDNQDDEVTVNTEMPDTPKFSFGQPASSGGTSGGSLFGTANSGNNQNNAPAFGSSTGAAFGQNTASTATPFGSGAQTPNTGNNGGNLFGGSGTATPTTNGQQQKPLFGASATPSSGFSFGNQQTTSSSTPATTASSGLTFGNAGSGNVLGASTGNTGGTFSFGNLNSSTPQSTSATPASTSGGGLFSHLNSTAPSSTQSGGGMFGRPAGGSNPTSGSTTPQGQRQTQSSLSTTPAGNPPFAIFGQNNNASNSGASAAPSSSGAGATANSGATLFGSAAPNTASSQPASTGNLFNRPASSNSGGLFSQQTSSAASAPPTATTTSAPTSNLFGSTTATSTPAASQPAASAAPSAGTLFGGLRGSSNQPATTTATSSSTATGGLFSGLGGQSATTTPASTTSTGGGLFGAANAQPATTAPSSSGNTGGGIFGGATPATTTASSAGGLFGTANTNQPSTTTAASNTGLFGGATANQPSTTTAASAGGLFGATTNQPSTTTASSAGGLFGATTNQPSATAPSSTGGLFGAAASAQPSTTATTTAQSTGLGASTSGPAPPAQSRLAQKTMDEILTSWSTSLTLHQKSFQSLAKQVSGWDRMLVENSTRISQLYGRCFQAERDCTEVERQLSNVEHSQLELEALLERYEGEVDRLMDQAGMGDGGSGIGGVDAERERTYKMAENCSSRLNEMGQSLTTMIDEINDASTKLSSTNPNGQAGARADDPLSQIVRVLNQHLSQLQSIDSGAAALQGRVTAAQREARNLGQSQGLNGAARSIEEFGRSYLGRN